MGKKNNKNNQKNTVEDIAMKLLNDSRITGKHIELYNLVTNDFKNIKLDDPIYILNNKMLVLNKYNNYINKILTSTELDEEQIKKCLSNSYVRYMTYMLGISNV